MFVRLKGPARAGSGWFAALLYLFCVLAPGAALALGDAASCLKVEPAAALHMHAGSPHQDHAGHAHHDAGNSQQEHAQHQHDGKDAPNPCCAMLCLSALPADLPAIARPAPPISVCVSENSWRPPGEVPPRLYRPPIA
ncbi:hypothetical protein CQ12_19580 [Bradyrhizobium jicamae]|uniref:DUF2946 domain-containing protein n=1 Tax=Bradyrhizobium jicamae TaxID=280332 RepID=A0A0R3LU13_9BRAD|nr:hypothetical protein [Bradyrhizobium jicamae]KRR10670.1 hypothetical protein CQ12_19580 [Bradyrhizobium jicamae]